MVQKMRIVLLPLRLLAKKNYKRGKDERMVGRFEVLVHLFKMVKNWPTALLDYAKALVLRKNMLTLYKLRDGTKLFINARGPDRALLTQIWSYNVYTNLVDIKENDIVVDIGAHIGIFTIYAARKCKQVFAYEPVITNFRVLKMNTDVNGFKNVKERKLAVWDKHKRVVISLSEGSSAGHSIFLHTKKKERVQCITLADILKRERLQKVDFMKIDIEGCEADAICATPKKVMRKINKLAIECETKENKDKIKEYLARCGFLTAENPDPGYSNILFAVKNE